MFVVHEGSLFMVNDEVLKTHRQELAVRNYPIYSIFEAVEKSSSLSAEAVIALR
jgi:hypothetical protein